MIRGNRTRTSHDELDALQRRFAALGLDPSQAGVLEERCLPYIAWLESAAKRSLRSHYALSAAALLAGLILPALAGLQDGDGTLRWAVFALGLVVAIALGVDGRLNLEGRWLHYRRSAEIPKSECWLFVALAGPYEGGDHASAFPAFESTFEGLVRQEVATYVAGPALAASRSTQAP